MIAQRKLHAVIQLVRRTFLSVARQEIEIKQELEDSL